MTPNEEYSIAVTQALKGLVSPGYRLLLPGEIIKEGDEFLDRDEIWRKTAEARSIHRNDYIRRRKVSI